MGLLHRRRGGSRAAACVFETRNSDSYAVIVAVCSIACLFANSGMKCFSVLFLFIFSKFVDSVADLE
jgi:hypothetical protein